jgi:FixJ family two-component response regulator
MLGANAVQGASQGECVILAVDDDAAVLNSLMFALEVEGFAVRAFANPTELLAAKDWPTRGCFVIDYRLPGMNGLALLKLLRNRGITLPAILISASLSDEIRRQAKQANVPVFEKPLVGNRLGDSIRQLTAGLS